MRFWSDEETELLRELWVNPKVTKEDLLRLFKRSWNSLTNKAYELGLQSFTTYRGNLLDEEFLVKLKERILE